MKEILRTCLKCRNKKPTTEFYMDRSCKGGYYAKCKLCACNYYKKCSKCKKIKSKHLFYKNKNTQDKLESCCIACRGRKTKEATYFQRNKLVILLNQRDWNRRERKRDPFFKIKSAIRTRLCNAVKSKRWNKGSHFLTYIGCTREEFLRHIENQWANGMTWDNYGNKKGCWNLDHIRPISLAKTVEELYYLSHYTNLQPMWTEENIKKGNKSNL